MPERHGVDPRRRARRRAHPEAAVQQGVVHLEPELEPAPLGQLAGRLLLELLPRRQGLTGLCEAEAGAPDAVVRQLEEVDLRDWNQHQRPGPVVLVQIQERSLPPRLIDDRPHGRDGLGERRAVVEDEHGPERVPPRPDRENFILRIPRQDHLSVIDPDRVRAAILTGPEGGGPLGPQIGRLQVGRLGGRGRPEGDRKGHVQLFGRHHVG